MMVSDGLSFASPLKSIDVCFAVSLTPSLAFFLAPENAPEDASSTRDYSLNFFKRRKIREMGRKGGSFKKGINRAREN